VAGRGRAEVPGCDPGREGPGGDAVGDAHRFPVDARGHSGRGESGQEAGGAPHPGARAPPHPASPAAPCQGLGAHMGGAPPAAAAAGPAAPAPPLPEPTAPVGPLVAFLFFSNYPIFDRFNGGEVKI